MIGEFFFKDSSMEMPQHFKIVREADSADFGCVRVMLFQSFDGVRGWYLSPAVSANSDENVRLSATMIASSAVLRAISVAERLGVDLCIIDPDDLWQQVWGG